MASHTLPVAGAHAGAAAPPLLITVPFIRVEVGRRVNEADRLPTSAAVGRTIVARLPIVVPPVIVAGQAPDADLGTADLPTVEMTRSLILRSMQAVLAVTHAVLVVVARATLTVHSLEVSG